MCYWESLGQLEMVVIPLQERCEEGENKSYGTGVIVAKEK